MSNPTLVSARTIRTAFQTGALKVEAVKDAKGKVVSPASILGKAGDGKVVRGRLHPAFIEAYKAANPGHDYREKAVKSTGGKSSGTVTLPVTKTSKSGATLKRPVEVPMAEFRRLSGTTRGRVGAKAVEAATAAYMAEHGIS